MTREQGSVSPNSVIPDSGLVPRIVNDWDGLARRMGVPTLKGLTSQEVNRGLEIFGIDVSMVVWERAEEGKGIK